MIMKNEIAALVEKYLQTNDVAEFSHSFAPLFYDIEQTGEPEAIELANEIEALLAAMTAGVANDAEFGAALKALLDTPTVSVFVKLVIPSDKQEIISLFTAAAASAPGTVKLVPFGIAPSVGFGSTTAVPSTPQTSTGHLPWQQVIRA